MFHPAHRPFVFTILTLLGIGFCIVTARAALTFSSIPISENSTTDLSSLVADLRSLVIQLFDATNNGRPLTIGSKGTDVWALQVFLAIDGAGPASTKLGMIGPTGTFGVITQASLAEYQKSLGIKPAIGYLGPTTEAAILRTASQASPPTTAATTNSSPTNSSTPGGIPSGTTTPTAGPTGGVSVASIGTSISTPDTTPPTVTITVPLNGMSVSGSSVVLSATASDNVAVAGVTFKVNGATIKSEVTSSPYSIAWDTTAISKGSESIIAIARDTANNTTTSTPVTVTVENAPPTISSVSSTIVSTTTATITWTTDDPADSQIQYGLTTSYGSTTVLNTTLSTSHSISLSGLLPAYTYHYSVRSADGQGNVATSSDRTFTIAASLPSGTVGLWYMDQYQSSPRPYVPNSAVSGSAPQNLLTGSRRLFSSLIWGQTQVTVADDYATCPDGLLEASRLQWTNHDAYLTNVVSSLPAGTYTLRVAVKSNTTSSQNFRFGDVNATMDTDIASTGWQVFTKMITNPASNFQPAIRSVDTSSTADLLVCDFGLYAGSNDLGPDTLSGQLVLGKTATTFLPTYSNGALQFGSNKISLAQFGAAQSFSSATIIIVASKVTNTQSISWGIASADGGGDYKRLGLALENTGPEGDFNETNMYTGGISRPTYANLWANTFFNLGWSAFGMRYNSAATTGDIWLDDIQMFSLSTTKSPVSVEDMFAGALWNGGAFFYGDYKIAAIGLWNRALSDSEYREAYAALAAETASSSNAIVAKRIYAAEGDSITQGNGVSGGSYAARFGTNANPVVQGFNNAVSGSAISDLNSRAAALDATIPPNKNGRKFILSVLIGHNDLIGNSFNTSQFLTNLAAYLDARRAAGWTVVVGTELPSTVPGFNAARNTVNTTIRTWVGVHADAIADFAADPTMGPDAAASDTSLYPDGTHPTSAGQAILETVLRTVVNGL